MTITTDLTSIEGQIRLEIGDDTLEPAGIRFQGKNFSDDQLKHFYAAEGGNVDADPAQPYIGRASAKALEVASRDWAKAARQRKRGQRAELQDQAAQLFRQAEQLRRQYGRSAHSLPPTPGTIAVPTQTMPPGAGAS
jgi:hypothetical protein